MKELEVKRARMAIIAEILGVCRKPTLKTRIMYKTNMSYAGIQKDLKFLQEKKLLKIDAGAKYMTTETGLEFLKRYAALQDSLK